MTSWVVGKQRKSFILQDTSYRARLGPLDVGDVAQLRSQRQVRADAQHLPVCAPVRS